ncbi:hypothetical protein WK92_10610 [Burkholderia ubonensis]|nr:hypothetical protein WK82_02545 [Burkholderia ubonensis]KVW23816.1 hypothetical protein WK92_10610 [Burkholderia ubonensis]
MVPGTVPAAAAPVRFASATDATLGTDCCATTVTVAVHVMFPGTVTPDSTSDEAPLCVIVAAQPAENGEIDTMLQFDKLS